ncbi:MAG TPA: spore germination protein GerW family protein [Pyrinomonadaceae bacterium]|nr:spore germination protein GerW family protein [Pyrinomonadaceae bacterium]
MSLEKTNSADTFIGTMAEKLGAVARAATVFGEPVERDGITVIPVAKARWGFGGGEGHRKDEDGAGGGGGVQVTPVGFIEITNNAANFRPIRTVSLSWIITGSILGLFLLRETMKRR